MTCAVYARYARDEGRDYKSEVCNELLKCLDVRIPMQSYKLTPNMIKCVDQRVNFTSGESDQQTVERIKQHIIIKGNAHQVLRAIEMCESHKLSLFPRLGESAVGVEIKCHLLKNFHPFRQKNTGS